MIRILLAMLAVPSAGTLLAQEVSTIQAYVDSDICARLMLGPISTSRVECSQSTVKEGNDPVLVRLQNNMVFTPNKPKMLKEYVGQLADVSGQIKPKNGTVKLASVAPVKAESIPHGDPGRRLLDARNSRTEHNAQLHEKIGHELAMMPYWSEFDFISFTLNGGEVILTGWTVRITNRDTAYNIVKDLPGVEIVVNNIDVLPLGGFDMSIRADARARLQRHLGRYFWGSGSDIKIVVKSGQIILLGTVMNKMDSDIAYVQCNSVTGAFKVFNLLRVQGAEKNKS